MRCSPGAYPLMRFAFLALVLSFAFTLDLPARNVLLFTIDSCRADRFGCYGYLRGTTPQIDAWAKTGVVFRNAYSTSAWTAPGLVSILTGLVPPTHRINNRDHMGFPEMPTLLKIFRKEGFQVPNINFFTFAPYYRHLGLPKVDRSYFGSSEGDELLNWLRRSASTDQPFFLWYHSTLVHQPYNPGPEGLPVPLEQLEASPGLKAVMNGAIVPVGSTHFSAADKEPLDLLYDAEVGRVDRLFGEALGLLRSKALLEDTLIVLTADHGEELLDHEFVGHASTSLHAKLYEEIVRIPLIIAWPGKIEGPSVVERRVNQTDIFPTILDLFDLKVPKHVQGRNLLEDQAAQPVFLESVIADNQTTRDREHLWIRGLIRGDYKYLSSGELYHLGLDPEEKTNLIEEEAARAEKLRVVLERRLEQAVALGDHIFPSEAQVFTAPDDGECPKIFTPGSGETVNYDMHTGMLLFDWGGDKETTYMLEYDIGTGDHHIAGSYEVRGNHQLMGPLSAELWGNLRAWNPFNFRVSPKRNPPCWSSWVSFRF